MTKKRRALVLDGGGFRGAYTAGVLSEFIEHLPRDYFDSIYMSSVGGFFGPFFASGQKEIIEEVWRNHVDGKKIANYFNIFRGQRALRLDKLTAIMKKGKHKLDVDKIFESNAKLHFTLLDYHTGKTDYLSPTKENIFDIMEASSALPLFYRQVKINGGKYMDGGITEPVAIEKALEGDYDEIVMILNAPRIRKISKREKILTRLFFLTFPKHIKKPLYRQVYRRMELENSLKNYPNLKIIRPKKLALKRLSDTHKGRLNKTVDIGKHDGLLFLQKEGFFN